MGAVPGLAADGRRPPQRGQGELQGQVHSRGQRGRQRFGRLRGNHAGGRRDLAPVAGAEPLRLGRQGIRNADHERAFLPSRRIGPELQPATFAQRQPGNRRQGVDRPERAAQCRRFHGEDPRRTGHVAEHRRPGGVPKRRRHTSQRPGTVGHGGAWQPLPGRGCLQLPQCLVRRGFPQLYRHALRRTQHGGRRRQPDSRDPALVAVRRTVVAPSGERLHGGDRCAASGQGFRQ